MIVRHRQTEGDADPVRYLFDFNIAMTKQAPARTLRFPSLSDAVTESEHLLAVGYRQTGQWTLADCLAHCEIWLASTFRSPIATPLVSKPIFWVLRNTIGPGMLRKVIEQDAMDPGLPTAKSTTTSSASVSREADAAAIEKIRDTIDQFERHDGPFLTSAVFGPMDRQKADALHRIHLAHHLGYLIPNDDAASR